MSRLGHCAYCSRGSALVNFCLAPTAMLLTSVCVCVETTPLSTPAPPLPNTTPITATTTTTTTSKTPEATFIYISIHLIYLCIHGDNSDEWVNVMMMMVGVWEEVSRKLLCIVLPRAVARSRASEIKYTQIVKEKKRKKKKKKGDRNREREREREREMSLHDRWRQSSGDAGCPLSGASNLGSCLFAGGVIKMSGSKAEGPFDLH
ncbi:hypothetical protein F5X96DRAFT_37123 [Biscogniauxia mediterranea]|nr:hypothetical protein F5X96DRAFT_37123 [Biscogniauxia mediterranea]